MTIIMDTQSRTKKPQIGDERTLLTAFLDWHRDTLTVKCSGLSDEQLKQRAVEPSSLSLLGLLRHMMEVERVWFELCIAGEEVTPVYFSEERPDDDFDALDSHSVTEVYESWQAACARSREITAKHELDFVGERRGEHFSLRWVLIHMIEEYARHNGHADFLRERIDGATGV